MALEVGKHVKMGIEIEYLIEAGSDGSGVRSGYGETTYDGSIPGHRILKAASAIIDSSVSPVADTHGHIVFEFRDSSKLLPDTFALLETVTGASTDLVELRKQLWTLKNALIKGAATEKANLSGAASPVAYRYEDFSSSSGSTCNNAGMHVHLDAPDDEPRVKFVNLLAQLIPELAAISSNSPIYARKKSESSSHRLSTSRLVRAEDVEVQTIDDDSPLQNDDPTKRYRFITPYTKAFKTVEVRGFDTPMTVDWAIAIAALLQAIAAKSVNLFQSEKRNTPLARKGLRGTNFLAARGKGIDAEFEVDAGFSIAHANGPATKIDFLYHHPRRKKGETVPAHLAIKRLLYFIEDELVRLDLVRFLDPIYEAVKTRKNQASLQLEWFDEGWGSYRKKLRQACEAPPKPLPPSGAGQDRKYFVVRQAQKDAKGNTVTLSDKGLTSLNLGEGETVIVSGPLGSQKCTLRRDARAATLGLDSDEVGLNAGLRLRLGVSVYDPVILGSREVKPLVVERCGAEWTEVALDDPPGQTKLKVGKGLEAHGAGKAAICDVVARRIGAIQGDRVRITAGEKWIVLPVVTVSSLTDSYICLMKADRDALGIDKGAEVVVRKTDQAGGDVTPTDATTAKVAQGSKDRGVGTVTVGRSLADAIPAKAGERIKVAAGSRNLVMVLAIDEGLTDGLARLMKKDRMALGVDLGAVISLSPADAIDADTGADAEAVLLTVVKGSKGDPDDGIVVRLAGSRMSALGIADGARLVIRRGDGAGATKHEAIARTGESTGRGEAGLREAARIAIGVKTGDQVRISLPSASDTAGEVDEVNGAYED